MSSGVRLLITLLLLGLDAPASAQFPLPFGFHRAVARVLSAVTGAKFDSVDVTVDFPADMSPYKQVTVRRLLGATPPSSDCITTGTQIKSWTGSWLDETFPDTGLTSSTAYSYRVCFQLLDNSWVAGDTVISVLSQQACGGYVYGGACFRAGAASGNCVDACTTYGGCDIVGIRDVVGSNGTLVACDAVLDQLFGAGTATNQGTCLPAGSVGCRKHNNGDYQRCTGQPSACETTTLLSGQRACSCNY